jgi:hypothetical protein
VQVWVARAQEQRLDRVDWADRPPGRRTPVKLMERFHQAFAAGAPTARSLAEAQRALLRDRTTRHPFFWAGVVAVEGSRSAGAGGGRGATR